MGTTIFSMKRAMHLFLIYIYALHIDSVTIFEPSIFDGSKIEVLTVLRHLNATVVVGGGHRGGRSPHSHVYDNDKGIIFLSKVPPIAPSHTSSSHDLFEEDVKKIFEFYAKDPIMVETDAFICSFPTSFCEAYLAFNKSIIWLAAHRYSLGRCSPEKWARLSEHIQQSVESGSHLPKSFVAAMSAYDAEYINYYTGLKPILMEATGMLYGAKTANYTRHRKEILIGPSQGIYLKSEDLTQFLKVAKSNNIVVAHPKSLYGRYRLHHLAQHRAAILFPYSTQSHSMIEMYAMGIPLFVPTMDFLLQLQTLEDRRQTRHGTCRGGGGEGVGHHSHGIDSHQSTITSTLTTPPLGTSGSYPTTSLSSSHHGSQHAPPRHANSSHARSPETDDIEDIKYWLQFSNYYQWPYITYFSSWDDLFVKLNNTDFLSIHKKMQLENEGRLARTIRAYGGVLSQIEVSA